MIDIEKLKELTDCEESENLEFKEARDNFNRDEVKKYCCVLANMKGGYLILGVKEKPREIIGSQVFNGIKSFGDLKRDILNEMQIRIEI
jgi:ATP-dependent DNA helicase RecG